MASFPYLFSFSLFCACQFQLKLYNTRKASKNNQNYGQSTRVPGDVLPGAHPKTSWRKRRALCLFVRVMLLFLLLRNLWMLLRLHLLLLPLIIWDTSSHLMLVYWIKVLVPRFVWSSERHNLQKRGQRSLAFMAFVYGDLLYYFYSWCLLDSLSLSLNMYVCMCCSHSFLLTYNPISWKITKLHVRVVVTKLVNIQNCSTFEPSFV